MVAPASAVVSRTMCLLHFLDLAAEHRTQSAQQRHGQQIRGRDGPVHARRVDHDEHQADQRGEHQVDGNGDQLLDVGADLLQFAQRLAAALVFEQRVGQFERMPDAVGIDARARPAG